ncbi:stage II sporulation protein E [Tenuibacillus multivorans]|uniref:Stage II sporulation protein E n=1 Tax=Tenuibacillus multivorans TaxID=237069 RepID=A0A1G9VY43_9BACI|nr:stage II sporulation protein E [Tenuibacillus multivorans]GEL78246.1 stage II sporulation protein E [Tenuibacillus multivorans]SDM77219.1 stage II sporulation protein E [Tenuibacillus multivorans]
MDMFSKVGAVATEQPKTQRVHQLFQSIKSFIVQKLFDQGWLLFIIGFFLGRAIILSSLSPFALAFLAATIITRKQLAFSVFLFLSLGALSTNLLQAVYIISAGLILMFIYKLFLTKSSKITAPMFIATLLSSMIGRGLYYLYIGDIVMYDAAILAVEAILSAFLVMIFLQSFPFLSNNRPALKVKVEELICLVILTTSVLTGFVGISLSGVELEQVGSKYFILLAAFISGATVGSAIGVIVGLMLSLVSTFNLYQVSLLALAGLLGGLLKATNKYGVIVGLFVSVVLIGMYQVDSVSFQQLLLESLVAATVFILTPKKLVKRIATIVPGTEEEKEAQEQYVKKVRNVTAERVEKFSEMFQALSHSFAYYDTDQKNKNLDSTAEVDEYLSRVTEKTCQTCLKKHACWVNNFDRTYSVLQNTIQSIENQDLSQLNLNVGKLKNFCVKQDQMVDQMRYELSFYQANQRLKQQVKESRKFVSEQLNGVSEVMNNFAKEILKERQEHDWHEEEIKRMVQRLNLTLDHLELYSIDHGNVDIEMTLHFHDYHGEGEKLIAPMLSELFDETIVVESEDPADQRTGTRTFFFSSIKNYQLTTGVAHAAKNGNFLSGDSYLMLELGKSRYALAISDGMGNGERAYLESSETLKLLKQILQSGINERVAIQSINSILSLRTSDEIYATLDLAIFDLQLPRVNFLKIGAMISFIIRAGDAYPVEGSNVPIGILEEFDVDPVNETLKDGDILVMVSDGLLETTHLNHNRETWLKNKLKDIETDEPQEIADLVLEEVVRSNHGKILDDMTVLVTKIEKSKPKWASFGYVNSL